MTAQAPVGGLIADMAAGISRLVRGEIALAKAEAGAMAQSVLRAVIFGLIGLAFAVTALNILAQACAAGLVGMGLSPGLALLMTGVGFALCAGIAVWLAVVTLDRMGRRPSRLARNLKRDFNSLKATETEDGSIH